MTSPCFLKSWGRRDREERRRGRGERHIFTFCIEFQTDCHRLVREQQRQVSKVLLDGLYDPNSQLSILLGDHHVFMKEVWQILVVNWQIFPTEQ